MAKMHVRARAVDMLGRQQIAGIPTAIHELFKNAHDAYAEHVEVDYFRADRTFVLRDDGYGMTKKEFENRWLTLGTESKFSANIEETPKYIDKGTPRRIILGEKGIGRLAIATIGRQVLILSRAKRESGLHDLVISFVHWGLFEAPGVELDKIVIPVETVSGGSLPSETDVKKLVDQVIKNVRTLAKEMSPSETALIMDELEAFSINPEAVDSVLKGLSLLGNGRGTHFYIMPTDTVLERDIDEISDDDSASTLQKMLLGFSNTMMPDRPPPLLTTKFRDHNRDGRVTDLIWDQEFFTPQEFVEADHHFEGEIDEFGQFRGAVSTYGQKPQACTIEWLDNRGKKTACGPFQVKFAYVQGNRRDSKVPPEEWERISAKLNKIGGLYIYRDGIRILPYGNSDYDFLNIERRRTKSAQDWFFSYRRIFGAIELTHEFNGTLKEKAGREGFIANTAYHQLRGIMEQVFRQLAITFFRRESDRGGEYNQIKAELIHQAELLQRREKRVRHRKAEFEKSLGNFFNKVEDGVPVDRSKKIRAMVESRLEAIGKLKDSATAIDELLKLESTAKDKVSSLKAEYTIKRPQGFTISKKARTSWHTYQNEVSNLERELFHPLALWIDKAVSKVAGKEAIALDRRRRASEAIRDTQAKSLRTTKATGREALKEAQELVEEVRTDSVLRIADVGEIIKSALAEFASVDTDELTDNQIRKKQEALQKKIVLAAETETDHIEAVINQIHAMREAMKAGDSLSDETAAMEAEYVGAKEQLELFAELAQIGTALGIVQHEFGATIRSVRENIQRLGEWADLDEELANVYSDIRASFEHLDGYLGMFTPLNRRLQRHKIIIVGEEIRRYLQHVFGARLERHKIRMVGTREFDQKTIEAYPSTYYPTFVNLVDNAIYWITYRDRKERLITLDADDSGFTVTNSGPGIPLGIKDWIFGFSNTEKDGGRGMGLYISRETLRKEGADIVLENPGKNNHPIFRILVPDLNDE